MKLCECGCGKVAPIAKKTANDRGHIKGEPIRFINGHQHNGENNGQWKGGVHPCLGGRYRRVSVPGVSRILEHRLIAEKALGKSLPPKAVVHHHTPEQLVVCQDQAYHRLLHKRQNALETCGHANWRKCPYCGKYDEPGNLHITPSGKAYHRECAQNHYQESKRR